jgi:hypothetical protein
VAFQKKSLHLPQALVRLSYATIPVLKPSKIFSATLSGIAQ